MGLSPSIITDPKKQDAIDRLITGYAAFRKIYYDDPVSFARHCVDWGSSGGLADYQATAMGALPTSRRVSVRSPHGVGKSAMMALSVLWFALTRDGLTDWKIGITASAWRQLTHFLLPEIHKWSGRLKWGRIGRPRFTGNELLVQNLKLSTGEAFPLTSTDPAHIEGLHASEILYIFDESKSIPDGIWDAAEGAFSTGSTCWLACSTPGSMQGRFFDIQSRKAGFEDWHVLHVTKAQAIAAGRMNKAWAEARKRQWGEESAVYQNRVEGNFAANDAIGVIPLPWVELANERWEAWKDAGFPGYLTELGVDVGEGQAASDQSTIAHCYDHIKIRQVEAMAKGNPHTATMALVAHLGQVMDKSRGAIAIVDSIGVGVGVVHRLAELNTPVIPFNAGRGTLLTDMAGLNRFRNWRAAGWWLVREMLDPANNFQVCLPPDDLLTGDLTAPQYRVISDGVIEIEAKESIRRRIGRSTDYADAVVHALTGPVLWDASKQEDEQVVVYERGGDRW